MVLDVINDLPTGDLLCIYISHKLMGGKGEDIGVCSVSLW